ncbi:distal membrane-arm assembly complex protein 2 [Nasonia vitripennis]|uniref:Mitochondrial ATP synthase regulatory component factor B n=1 Tax=Nasonia vitripennis TaxID=7425 RepID=A0A7M7LVD6_NASVI|nr:distal membrane-arm assembly complex protein 2 [Nasonia vitripennis]XP_008217085.1 distal membrane-arm assembly complex protein 2 [Nasonia vitripennis]
MLSQKILNVIKFSKNQVYQAWNTQFLTTSARVLNRNERSEEKSNLYEEETSGSVIEKRESDRKSNLVREDDNIIYAILKSNLELTPWGMKKYFTKKKIEIEKQRQSFSQERIDFLGADLAVAHFLVFQGGKVKFRGSDKWIELNEDKKTADLPSFFNSKYILTAFDASGIEMYYEALDTLNNVPKVTHINFSRSPHFDDWFMDKLSSMYPNLEYLDVSDCPKLSERGLEALYKNSNLKTLIVTNHYKSAAFELTCMMLQDILPELEINIITPKEKMKPIINTYLVT